MHSVIMPDPGATLLKQTTAPTQLRDAEGELLGVFTPALRKFTREEVERLCQGPTYTTVEVFEHLLSLADNDVDRADLTRHIHEIKARNE